MTTVHEGTDGTAVADWTQDDLVLVTRRADALRRVAAFIEDQPHLANLFRHSARRLHLGVDTRAQIEALTTAAAGQQITEWSDDLHGGVEIAFGAGVVVRVYAPVAALGQTGGDR